MAKTLYWIQGGSCGGDTWSLFNAETPDIIQLFESLGIDILWHQALWMARPAVVEDLNRRILSGEQRLDILCVEGAVIHGPNGTGRFDMLPGGPKKDIIKALAQKARYVIAVGTCASFGGIGIDSPTMAGGLQFTKWEMGGLLGQQWRSFADYPVINLPGCPCHCDVMVGTLSAIAEEAPLTLGHYNTPVDWYGIMVHQGCTRNEYHEYRVEEKKFGEKGCLFFYMGCHGPLVTGPCNKALWNRRSSKTRVGVPCFGCTSPDFPHLYPFFETRNIEGIPIELPDGVSRAHYMAYKGMAAAAAPKRLIKRKTGI
ncbi:MAG: NADH:ubiquinone oxidoreductase [Desulfobacterales bacterium]|jgi:hydrogenase small subunit|nr:NADH:ubiquinone oxidoreductase [Desulfobacterales bacterium]